MACCEPKYRWLPAWLAAVACTAMITADADAGGFSSPHQSATALGTAFAGASARADDASFFLFNPATISAMEGSQTYFDARAFAPTVKITPSHATSPLGAPLAGDSDNLVRNALAVGSVTVLPLAPGLTLGFGSSVPFATDVETSANWGGQYQLLHSYIVGLNASGAVSWQATPWLAVAAGVQVQYMQNDVGNAVVIPLGAGPPVGATAYMKTTGWAAGPVAGLVLTPTSSTRIGLSWRSGLTQRMKGTAGTSLPVIPIERLSYDLDLPQSFSIGLEQRVGRDWRLFAEWSYVDWSRFKGFDVAFASGRPNELRPIDWRASWMAAVGAGYHVTRQSELTAGVSYDTGASRDGTGSTLSPDANKVLLGIGINHDIAGAGRLSISYGHLWLLDAPVKASSPVSGTLDGSLSGHMHTAGMGYTYKW